MNRAEQVQLILARAAEAAPEQLADVLQRECGADIELRKEVESLLHALSHAGRFLAAPTVNAPAAAAAGTLNSHTVQLREGPGMQIGPYKLLQLIGEGGFGSVFMAEQEQPVRRKVALKIIKLGLDTRQVVARFDQERHALALMDHSNIARVLDAGATETGRPYFVMELVKGEPIVAYCDRHSKNIPERLELFSQVCAAVQHAHTKGVIHRDLKPGNILVSTQDGRPHVKVIDFGIAKATDARLTEMTLFTEHQQLIGTPEYMSPEQAEGSLDVDTRTDVYSLGVLLYELLTGTTPFSRKELRCAAYAEIQRIIREVEPPNPSTRLSRSSDTLANVASQRRTQPTRLGALIRGELDWIVMKALEKDRARRYDSPSGFATDVQRYLAGEAVLAAPPSAAYKLSKLIHRRKGLMTAISAVGLSLVIGVIGFAWQARVAMQQRDAAEAARAEAKQRADELQHVSDFQGRMLMQVEAAAAGGQLFDDLRERFGLELEKSDLAPADRAARAASLARDLSQINAADVAAALIDRMILLPSVREIDQQFKDQPVVDAKLRYAVATVYHALGLDAKALPFALAAADALARVTGPDTPNSMLARGLAALLLENNHRMDEAIAAWRIAYDSALRAYGPAHEDTLTAMSNLGNALRSQCRFAEAEPLLRGALEGQRRVLGDKHRSTLISLNTYGYLLIAQGKLTETEKYWREAYETGRRALGPDDPDVLIWAANIGGLLADMEKYDAAAARYRDAVEGFRRVRGAEHSLTLSCMDRLAETLRLGNRPAEAESVLQEILDARQRTLAGDDPTLARALTNLAEVRMELGKLDEAQSGLTTAERMLRRKFPEGTGQLAGVLWRLGRIRLAANEPTAALPLLEEAVAMITKYVPADNPDVRKLRATLEECRKELARDD